MNITHISGSNIKGKTFAHDLTHPITIFTGLNGKGKSARLDTIQLALFGAHPALSKTNEGVMQLCSGSIMTAEVRLSDGSRASNYWNQTKSGTSCKGEGSISPKITPLCLNPSEYFDLSDRERTKLVFKLCKSSSNFRNEVVAQAKGIKLEDHDAATEEIVQTVCGKVSAHEPQMGDSTTEWLENLAEMVKKQVSTTMAAAKRMSATLSGLTELRALVSQPVNSAAERELASVNAQVAEIDLKIRELETEHQEIRKKLARKVELEGALASKTTRPITDAQQSVRELEEATASYQSKLPDLRAKLSVAESELAALKKELARTESLIEQAKKTAALVEEAKAVLDPKGSNELGIEELKSGVLGQYDNSVSPEPELAKARTEVVGSEQSLTYFQNQARSRTERIDRIKADLSKYDIVPECEHCHWKAQLTKDLNDDLAAETAKRDEAMRLVEAYTSSVAASRALLVKAEEAMQVYEAGKKKVDDLRRKLFELEARKKWAQQILQSHPSAPPAGDVDAIRQKLIADQMNIAELKQAIAGATLEDITHKKQLASLASARKLVEEIQAEEMLQQRLLGELESLSGIGEPSLDALNDLRSRRATLSSRIAPLSLEVRQSMAARGEAATKLIAAEEALKVSREEKVWREVKKIVDEVQAKAVHESVGPIIDAANVICDGILPSPLVMHEGVIGRFAERKFVTTKTFNKSDQQIAFAAICVALAGASGCPLKLLLMDDLDNIEDDRLEILMEKVQSAIRFGVVTQMIGCSVRDAWTGSAKDIEVISL